MSHATNLLDAMSPLPAIYADSVGTFGLKLHVQEFDKAFRTSTRDRLIGAAASGAAAVSCNVTATTPTTS